MVPTVHIRKEAFLVLTWSAIEAFKNECYGFLLGHPPTAKNNFYTVTDAVPFQKARRSNTEVNLYEATDRKFKRFISDIGRIYPKYLGDFHSHTEWGEYYYSVEMSDYDLSEFMKTTKPLECIIGISSRKKGRAVWESLPDGSVKGSFGKHNLHFNFYALDSESEKAVRRLVVVAPRPIKTLNRI